MAAPDADSSWIHRLLHPPPVITITATPAECGQVTIDARARRRSAWIELYRPDGSFVRKGKGRIQWTGYVGADRVIAKVERPKKTQAEASVQTTLPLTVTFTAPAEVQPYLPAPVGAVRTDEPGGCAIAETVDLVVTVDGKPRPKVAMMQGHVENLGPTLLPGPHTASAVATWRGYVVGEATWAWTVPSPAFDLDDDGLTDKAGDCDDHDVYVRPGLPDVVGDGRDNDCDGKNAGDLDGDGYVPSGPVSLSSAEKAKVTELYGVGAAARIDAWPRSSSVATDCNDRDASIHPFSAIKAKSCKQPVTVPPGPAVATSGPDTAIDAGKSSASAPLKVEVSTAGATWYGVHLVGSENVQDLKLKVELEGGDYWIELWDGGPWTGSAAGPLAQLRPILDVRSDRSVERPLPKKNEGTWTGGLWRGATNAGGLTPFALIGAALITPMTVFMDASDANSKANARARGKIANDALLYIRIVPVGPGERHGTLSVAP